MKRALISVTDKTGVVDFARRLKDAGYEIVSTGNTYKVIKDGGVDVVSVDEVTGFPEILDGRVKTLNPFIHGGILYKRDDKSHCDTVKEHVIGAIDIVVVSLYDFEGAIRSGKSHEDIVENIDIGGPSMIRSAAKNYNDVCVVVDIDDYDMVADKIENGSMTLEDRQMLAYKAFSKTARYDALISSYFQSKCGDIFPDTLNLTFEKECELRYGENGHQRGFLYSQSNAKNPVLDYEQIHGKELSFNNINDLYGCLEFMREFKEDKMVASVAIKHSNACGVGLGVDSYESFKKCYESDKISIFGGIVGITSKVCAKTAEMLNKIFLEIVVAYDFDDDALEILKSKKNIRILKLKKIEDSKQVYDMKYLDGKLLIQDRDVISLDELDKELKVVTKLSPSDSELDDMKFGMKVAKNLKSNAIAIVKDAQTLAIGCGQTSRIWALKNAIENNKDEKSFDGAVLASDAFFPFDDCVRLAAEYGIKAIIQPGGSMRDEDSIKACDKLGISMVFTGVRHFKH